MRRSINRVLLSLFLTIGVSLPSFGQNEAYYIEVINKTLKGQTEVKVENGRVDIVTDDNAIEVEWASNWKHSVGQALWYGLQTTKRPGIILLMNNLEDRKYGIMLGSALEFAGIKDKIDVWLYPEDFGGSFQEMADSRISYKQDLIARYGNYTMNKKTGARHNSRCTYFNCPNCIPCGPNDGKKACGKCGG